MGTYKINATWTSEMIQDLQAQTGFDSATLVAEVEKQKKYEHRKRIVEKLLKENKTNQ